MTNSIFNSYTIGKFFLLFFVCFCLINCSAEKPIEHTVIIVKVPPIFDEKLSREEKFWRYQHFLFPQIEIPNPIPKGLPNDGSLLFVEINGKGKIELNSQTTGNVSATDDLSLQLAKIFSEREKNGMFEPGNSKIIKAVGIKTANSVKYEDFIKVVEAVKDSGAQPIVLLFDDTAKPQVRIDL